jgi:hypothetical protein
MSAGVVPITSRRASSAGIDCSVASVATTFIAASFRPSALSSECLGIKQSAAGPDCENVASHGNCRKPKEAANILSLRYKAKRGLEPKACQNGADPPKTRTVANHAVVARFHWARGYETRAGNSGQIIERET